MMIAYFWRERAAAMQWAKADREAGYHEAARHYERRARDCEAMIMRRMQMARP